MKSGGFPLSESRANKPTINLAKETVIDNKEGNTLEDHLNFILPETKKASIAVGYFFISGFDLIMDKLEKLVSSTNPDHKIRLLISPKTDRMTAEALLAANEAHKYVMIKSKQGNYVGSATAKAEIRRTLEYMPQKESDKKAVLRLIELVEKGKIEVKVYTREQLHAKAYIFETNIAQIPHIAIVGSSNLSLSGIREHTELNLKTLVQHDADQLLKWFEDHWNDKLSVPFTKEIAEIISRSWAGKMYSSSDVYGKAALHETETIEKIESGELFEFQRIAVGNSIKKLDIYGGVIVADVVGMGKSYVGAAIMQFLQNRDHTHPLIICPPHLENMWQDYLIQFKIHGTTKSRYKIGKGGLDRYTSCDVVLVDESHNFRNTNTNAYNALSKFMEEKTEEAKIIMLTATPISNGYPDLKHQLALFPKEKLSLIPPLSGTTLEQYFKIPKDTPESITEEKIRELLKYILIRRTRPYIKKNFAKKDDRGHYLITRDEDGNERKNYFPDRNTENPAEYKIDEVYHGSFDTIIDILEKIKLARYTPGQYIRDEYLDPSNSKYNKKYVDLQSSIGSLRGIMKTTLLKRMESSIKAFESSVKNYGYSNDMFCKEIIGKRRIPIGKEFQNEIYKKITNDGYGDKEYEEKMADIESEYDYEAFDIESWKRAIEDDVTKLKCIPALLWDNFEEHDDKLHTLEKLINKINGKILIFSESAVTAQYIYNYLKYKVGKRIIEEIDSSKIINDQTSKKKSILDIIRRFDPKNNNYELKPGEKEIDILISTDVLSEGVNLQACGVIINYDFHWNPVRLIQRIGRVDRIGSDHRKIKVINFLQTTKMDEHLTLGEKVGRKLDIIHKVIGIGEGSVLISGEKTYGVEDIYTGDESILDNPEFGSIMGSGAHDAVELDAERIRNNKTEFERIQDIPFGVRSIAGHGRLFIACEAQETVTGENGDVVKNQDFRKHYEVTNDGVKTIYPSAFLHQLSEASKTGREEPSDANYDNFVAEAWIIFTRDVKNAEAKKSRLKHQIYFDGKIKEISERLNLKEENREKLLSLFELINRMMVTTKEPYRKLGDLRKRIDRDTKYDDNKIVESLWSILYECKTYEKRISKPRILYSVMTNLEESK